MRSGLAAAAVAGAAVLALALAPRAHAGEMTLEVAGEEGTVRVRTAEVVGGSPGWGYARVEMHNDTPSPQRVHLRLQDFMGPGHGAHGTQALAPGERAVREVPISSDVDYAMLHVSVEGGETQSTSVHRTPVSPSVLLVGPAARRARLPPSPDPYEAETGDLPSRWTLLSSFDVVVVDGGDAALDAARQETLLAWTEAGGRLLVDASDRLGPGPLRALREGAGGASEGRLGFGTWHLREEHGAADARGPIVAPGLLRRLAVPGVTAVPARAFFFLILGFAVVTGPVAYLWLRRRRQLAWMLVSIPVVGFGCAAAILLYGLLSEGLGTRGAAWSVSILDQARGRVATAASRTLYAGRGPDLVRPDPGTVLVGAGAIGRLGRRAFGSDDRGRAPFRFDLDRGALEGSVVPSRTPTAFGSVSRLAARERLRFRRRPDGGYDVLADAAFAPVAEPGSILLRLADGQEYLGDGTGLALHPVAGPVTPEDRADAIRLAPLSPTGAFSRSDDDDRFVRHIEYHSVASGAVRSGRETWVAPTLADAPTLAQWIRTATELPPGRAAYLARVRAAPFVDALGLDVDWKAQDHVVLGLLGPDDVVEGP
jgi:hypothetical protein